MIKRYLIIGCTLLLGGCVALQPANYRPHYGNYRLLQNQPQCSVAVTKHKTAKANIQKLSIRGSPFKSPTGDGFSGFIAAAMNEEFEKGGIFKMPPQRALTLSMEENVLDTGMGIGSATIGVIVTVLNTQTSAEIAQFPVHIRREWKSSFVGVTAMNVAVGEYSEAVAQLNGKLFADPLFRRAIDCPRLSDNLR